MAERKFLKDNFLSKQTLEMISRMVQQFARALETCGFLAKSKEYDENASNSAIVKALLVAALYPNVATVTAKPRRSVAAASGRGQASALGVVPLQLKTVDMWAKNMNKAARRKEKIIFLHPSSVLENQSQFCSLAVKAAAQQAKADKSAASSITKSGKSKSDSKFKLTNVDQPFVVFHGRVKTSRVFICDASVVGPLPLLLFGGSIAQTDIGGGLAILKLDNWLRFKLEKAHAALLLELRRKIMTLLAVKLENPRHDLFADPAAVRTVAAVAALVQGSAGESLEVLPKGWRAEADPASSTGRVFYRNLVTMRTQWERPTQSASKVGNGGAGSMARAESERKKKKKSAMRVVAARMKEKEKAKQAETETESEVAAGANAEKAKAKAKRNAEAQAAVAASDARAKAKAEAEAAELSALTKALYREQQAAEAAARRKNGIPPTTVAALLSKLDINHYSEKFEEAGVGDYELNDVIDFINEDPVGGAQELEGLIASVGLRGGAAVKVRKALTKKKEDKGVVKPKSKKEKKNKGKDLKKDERKGQEKKREKTGPKSKKAKTGMELLLEGARVKKTKKKTRKTKH